jgi:hypothetical protein
VNVPRAIASVIAGKYATLTELSSTLGAEDLYDLLEVMAVEAHNSSIED